MQLYSKKIVVDSNYTMFLVLIILANNIMQLILITQLYDFIALYYIIFYFA